MPEGITSTHIGEIVTYFKAPVKILHILASTSRSAIIVFMDGERRGSQATLTFKRLERVG